MSSINSVTAFRLFEDISSGKNLKLWKERFKAANPQMMQLVVSKAFELLLVVEKDLSLRSRRINRLMDMISLEQIMGKGVISEDTRGFVVAHLAQRIALDLLHNRSLSEWKEKIGEIAPEKQREVLNELLKKICECLVQEADSKGARKRLVSLFSQETLETISGTTIGARTDKNFQNEAKDILEKMAPEFHVAFKTRLYLVGRFVLDLFESIIDAFGLAEFFKPSGNSEAAHRKSTKVVALIGLLTLTNGILAAMFPAATVGLIIGLVLLTIIVLSLVYPKIKPTPGELDQFENWTKFYLQGSLSEPEGRERFARKMTRTLLEQKRNLIIVAEPGQGKTMLVQKIVAEIARKHPKITIFYTNMGKLVNHRDQGGGNNILPNTRENVGPNNDQVIYVFDEFQAAFKSSSDAAFAETLKSMVDGSSPQSFKYVIAVTTKDEYERYIKNGNSPFVRRFEQCLLNNTPEHETTSILTSYILNAAPWLLMAKDGNGKDIAIETLIAMAKSQFRHAPFPKTPASILNRCIQIAKESRDPEEYQDQIDLTLEKIDEDFREALESYEQKKNQKLGKLLAELGSIKKQINDLESQPSDANDARITQLEDAQQNIQTQINKEFVAPLIERSLRIDNNNQEDKEKLAKLVELSQCVRDLAELQASRRTRLLDHSVTTPPAPRIAAKIQGLETKIKKIRDRIDEEKAILSRFSKSVDNLAKCKKEKNELILKVSSTSKWIFNQNLNRKMFLLIDQFFYPALEKRIREERPRGVFTTLDAELITRGVELEKSATGTGANSQEDRGESGNFERGDVRGAIPPPIAASARGGDIVQGLSSPNLPWRASQTSSRINFKERDDLIFTD